MNTPATTSVGENGSASAGAAAWDAIQRTSPYRLTPDKKLAVLHYSQMLDESMSPTEKKVRARDHYLGLLEVLQAESASSNA